jgi:hypothetical protein
VGGNCSNVDISASELPGEKDLDRRIELPLSAHEWDSIADTKQIIVDSGTLTYENGFDRVVTATVCEVWLYYRVPEDKLNPIQGRGSTCDRLPKLLKNAASQRR